MADYVLEGPRWKASGGVTTVTWALDATLPASYQPEILEAFAAWSGAANITFRQVASGANITLGLGAIDGAGRTLGYASYTFSGDSFVSARITFDSGEGWRTSATGIASAQGADFGVVAIHEIGHAIGLDHFSGAAAVMNPSLSSRIAGLTASDVAGVQALYGAPGAPSGPAVAAAQPFHFTRGSFDADYYLATYADVARAAAGGDSFAFAAQHYRDHGWKEGRDPSAFFDTKAYLATYGDVRAAGIDPLQHYDDHGWKEGRDPSGKFDTDAYRAAYADVAAAGIDPLQHYLQFGRYEGRSAFADGLIA